MNPSSTSSFRREMNTFIITLVLCAVLVACTPFRYRLLAGFTLAGIIFLFLIVTLTLRGIANHKMLRIRDRNFVLVRCMLSDIERLTKYRKLSNEEYYNSSSAISEFLAPNTQVIYFACEASFDEVFDTIRKALTQRKQLYRENDSSDPKIRRISTMDPELWDPHLMEKRPGYFRLAFLAPPPNAKS